MADRLIAPLCVVLAVMVLLCGRTGWSQAARVWLDANNNVQINTTNVDDTVIVSDRGGRLSVLTQAAGAAPRLNVFPAIRVRQIYIRTFDGDDSVFQISTKPASIMTHGGNDRLLGGSSYEFADLGEGVDVAYTRKDDDLVDGEEHRDLIILGPGDDAGIGGSGPDLILGQADDDILITGMEGRDILFGGSGKDDIRGNPGDDFLFGGGGADELHGLDGNDILCGGGENDKLAGGTGDDGLWGEPGADHHDGGAGNDRLYGNPQRGDTFANGRIFAGDFDCLKGEPGKPEPPGIEVVIVDDTVYAVSDGVGHVFVAGTAADDVIVVRSVENGVAISHEAAGIEERLFPLTELPDVVVQGGDGDDRIEISGTFSRSIVDGNAGNDVLTMSNAVYDGLTVVDDAGDDRVELGAGPAFVATEPGRDQIGGGSGIRYVANPGLEPTGDPDLILLDTLDWPDVEVEEEPRVIPIGMVAFLVLATAFILLAAWVLTTRVR